MSLREDPEIILVSSPTASRTALSISVCFSPSIFSTIPIIQASLKLMAREPLASPVIPMMPEMSPQAVSSVFAKGLPGTGLMKAIFSMTSIVPYIKGLINLTSIGFHFLGAAIDQ